MKKQWINLDGSFYKFITTIKELSFKGRGYLYWPMFILLGLLNLWALPYVLDTYETEVAYLTFALFIMAGGLVVLSCITPICMTQKNTPADEAKPFMSAWMKTLSMWVSVSLCVIVQTLILVVLAIINPQWWDAPFLLAGLGIIGLFLLWSIMYSLLYVLAGGTGWYFVGAFAINFSTMIIGNSCYEIYNLNPLLRSVDSIPLRFNVFIMTLGFVEAPLVAIAVVAVVALSIFAVLFAEKKDRRINLSGISLVYKLFCLLLIAISAGFWASSLVSGENLLSSGHIVAFLSFGITTALAITYLGFRKRKPILPMCMISVAVCVSCLLAFFGIPAMTEKKAYSLPKEKEIVSASISIASLEEIETDEHFAEYLALHQELFELFKEGNLPSTRYLPNEDTKCIANIWEDVIFKYELKNGKQVFRSYSNLNDPAFDEFFIEYLKSDAYMYSLQSIYTPEMTLSYSKNGSKVLRGMASSKYAELIATYCEELREADSSAFYEEYKVLRLEYGDQARNIYIPKSFDRTLKLLNISSNQ